jgi:hypothetical protein
MIQNVPIWYKMELNRLKQGGTANEGFVIFRNNIPHRRF